jgi:hypothetical protein
VLQTVVVNEMLFWLQATSRAPSVHGTIVCVCVHKLGQHGPGTKAVHMCVVVRLVEQCKMGGWYQSSRAGSGSCHAPSAVLIAPGRVLCDHFTARLLCCGDSGIVVLVGQTNLLLGVRSPCLAH